MFLGRHKCVVLGHCVLLIAPTTPLANMERRRYVSSLGTLTKNMGLAEYFVYEFFGTRTALSCHFVILIISNNST